MSPRVAKVMLTLKGLAFGFLLVSAALGGTLDRIVGFGVSAMLMGAAAVLLHASLPRAAPPPRVSRITLRGVPRADVVITEKTDLDRAA